jgi:hypothetical protein
MMGMLLAMRDLSLRLKTYHTPAGVPLDMPKHIIFQFDNSRENKVRVLRSYTYIHIISALQNRYMFTYLSMLVEMCHLDRIDVNFLVVGHTHASIDQFFSVLAKAIDRTKCIVSPLALEKVIREAFKNDIRQRKVIVVRQIRVVHNYTEALKYIVNKKIKYFVVPHNFKITRHMHRAITQYRLFSTNNTWLPRIPEYVPTKEILESYELFVMEHKQYDSIGGVDRFDTYTGIDATSRENDKSGAVLRRVINRQEVMEDMAKMEAECILQCEIHCENPDIDAIVPTSQISNELKWELEVMLKGANTQAEGFIIWVQQSRIDEFARKIAPLVPECEDIEREAELVDRDYARQHRPEYLRLIKDSIMNMDASIDFALPDRSAASQHDIMQLIVMSEAQKKKRLQAEKDVEKISKKTGAAKISAAARNIFSLIWPDRFISVSHSDGMAN